MNEYFQRLQEIENACANNSALRTEICGEGAYAIHSGYDCALLVRPRGPTVELYLQTLDKRYFGVRDISEVDPMPATLKDALADSGALIRGLESKFSGIKAPETAGQAHMDLI